MFSLTKLRNYPKSTIFALIPVLVGIFIIYETLIDLNDFGMKSGMAPFWLTTFSTPITPIITIVFWLGMFIFGLTLSFVEPLFSYQATHYFTIISFAFIVFVGMILNSYIYFKIGKYIGKKVYKDKQV